MLSGAVMITDCRYNRPYLPEKVMDVAIHESINKVFSFHAEDVEAKSTAFEPNPGCKHEQECSKNDIGQPHVRKYRRCLHDGTDSDVWQWLVCI